MPRAENSSLDNTVNLGTSGSSQNITSQGQNAYTVTFLAASVTTHHQIQKRRGLVAQSNLGSLATQPREGTYRELILFKKHTHTHIDLSPLSECFNSFVERCVFKDTALITLDCSVKIKSS